MGVHEQKTAGHDDKAAPQAEKEAVGRHHRSGAPLPAAQSPGDIVARTVAKEKADGLDQRHIAEHHPHRAGDAGAVQQTDKISIRHVVKGRDQHTDNRGERQLDYQTINRLVRHPIKFLIHPFAPAFRFCV